MSYDSTCSSARLRSRVLWCGLVTLVGCSSATDVPATTDFPSTSIPAVAPSSTARAGSSSATFPSATTAPAIDGTEFVELRADVTFNSSNDDIVAALVNDSRFAGIHVVTPRRPPEPGSVRIELSEIRDPAFVRVTVTVTDDGVGTVLTSATIDSPDPSR